MGFVPFLLYVLVTSFTPGPNNFMAMSNASRYGFAGTLRFSLGVGAGFFVIVMLCSYFNLFLYSLIPTIQFVMSLLGSAYMIYLAVKIMRSKPGDPDGAPESMNSFAAGAVLQFVNPKAILYGITVTSTFILPFYQSHLSLILFALGLALVGILSTSSWALFGSLFQRFLAGWQRSFNVLMGLLLIYSAAAIFM
ncbi:LysE family transporter [Paenibacillus mucilaginosus]|uniref:Lysine exporter protein LysE/YggA n=3 Tax=Paenibacillus mucilaginosus TaxID=61624 RepID=H6NEH3_9BACL|nr:LysE family transporter [Paenibacillus mucilaginosus]AEI42332.1 Lysine exporter protein (LYSE/YGGA) [Paenibacillus mucilaginosus KNP414]AFC28116.1 lysine exporter protein LysE/YggA [Paenibacillus mucilaginosus 3016]AFH60284.1 amino acid transporter LysE [Paenibacillus mucilaginosus K02]MCG7214288.1 LysE family transporter [Paenibacillus mucilaginosus]WDM28796.1 LysE family transporter [Paenibacillus mucilaginosus]